ncbi:MAG: adenylyltransferase/cytidyltransferase family protein [Planctomycetia bacterium]|nr:adenylyltransferase/cytidyltransferase family protein [Planctomycetia bacterium]
MRRESVAASGKIKELDELAAVSAELREQGKTIVHCHGVFDLLHVGHIRHLESARRHGDVLIVTLTPDQWVNKGPLRPAFEQTLRAEMVASLACVDYVAINQWPQATDTIKLLKPRYYVKGSDYRNASQDVTGGITLEEEAVRSVGGEIVFTDDLTFSSSALINRHMPVLAKEASDFVAEFAERHPRQEIMDYFDGARKLKVLVLGESIIDQYHYCETLGKSGKEPILAVRLGTSEKFAGGILAVANHVASFTDNVKLISYLGDENPQEEFLREKLNPTVDPTFLMMRGAPTIVKQRFIENYPFQKIFEVYLMKDDQDGVANTQRLCEELERILPEFDLVIATDYGHGMIEPPVVQTLCRHARCLAVNTQANAGNHGFNTVSKYPRADFVCVSENEIRLEARQKREDLYHIVEAVVERMQCRKVMITRGKQGMLSYDREEGFVEVPAWANRFTDRMGAGDAVFGVTSLLMAQGAPADVLGFVGNAVGAMAVAIVGNRSAVDRAGLTKFITALYS